MQWLRRVALDMVAADAHCDTAADRREAIFDASRLKGDAADGMLPMIGVALREFERKQCAGRVDGLTAAEFVADRLEWDPEHQVAPDSHRRRILRALEGVSAFEMNWARGLLALK